MTERRIRKYAALCLFLAGCGRSSFNGARFHQQIDFDWRFSKGDVAAAGNVDFNDGLWSTVSLPHDWMVEGPIAKDNPSGVAGGFFPGDVGWYRKSLTLSKEQEGKKVYLQFDGIYRNSDVWVNGQRVGHRTYGYVSHFYDITPYVTFDKRNVIAVRVDGSVQPIDRWYSGCGIYRHVWVSVVDPVHVPIWGTYVTTPSVQEAQATVSVRTDVRNDSAQEQACRLVTRIIDPLGKEVSRLSSEEKITAGSAAVFKQDAMVSKPQVWDVDHPNLYKAASSVYVGGRLADDCETPFGIRTVEFTPGSGFVLNGRKLILRGVCLHHDGGSVGAAVPEAVWQRRLQILKDMGVNAVRLAHNPHAPEVLDMCDRMGLLVFDEMYDKWAWPWESNGANSKWPPTQIAAYTKEFEATWRQDLHDFVDRDKNHPSVAIWSVGNETMEQLKDPNAGVQWLQRMVANIHEQDPGRKVTCALHPYGDDNPSRMMGSVDVVSYNYRTQDMAEWHKKYPDYIWISSETKAYGNEAPKDWTQIDYSDNSWFYLRDFVAGQFIWAGIDYLGESRDWPDKGIRSGLIFTTGFRKPYSYFTESLYSSKSMVHIVAVDDVLAKKMAAEKTWQESWYGPPVSDHWTFPERKGRSIAVLTYTNCDLVELQLNGKSLGSQALANSRDRVIRWDVPYSEGTIVAIGHKDGQVVCRHELTTAGAAANIVLAPDQTTLHLDGKDMAHIEVRITDANNVLVPRAANKVHFTVEGPARIIGIDNGDMSDPSSPTSPDRECRDGRLLLMVQADRDTGGRLSKAVDRVLGPDIVVKAEAAGLNAQPLKLRVR
jgi:beta-galactosidase